MTAIGIIIPTLIAMYNINRARKKDIDNKFKQKADIAVVSREFKIRDERIIKVESMSNLQEKYMQEKFEEQHAILNVIQQDIKTIIGKIK